MTKNEKAQKIAEATRAAVESGEYATAEIARASFNAMCEIIAVTDGVTFSVVQDLATAYLNTATLKFMGFAA